MAGDDRICSPSKKTKLEGNEYHQGPQEDSSDDDDLTICVWDKSSTKWAKINSPSDKNGDSCKAGTSGVMCVEDSTDDWCKPSCSGLNTRNICSVNLCAETSISHQETLQKLQAMFPSLVQDVLKSYVEIYRDTEECIRVISNIMYRDDGNDDKNSCIPVDSSPRKIKDGGEGKRTPGFTAPSSVMKAIKTPVKNPLSVNKSIIPATESNDLRSKRLNYFDNKVKEGEMKESFSNAYNSHTSKLVTHGNSPMGNKVQQRVIQTETKVHRPESTPHVSKPLSPTENTPVGINIRFGKNKVHPSMKRCYDDAIASKDVAKPYKGTSPSSNKDSTSNKASPLVKPSNTSSQSTTHTSTSSSSSGKKNHPQTYSSLSTKTLDTSSQSTSHTSTSSTLPGKMNWPPTYSSLSTKTLDTSSQSTTHTSTSSTPPGKKPPTQIFVNAIRKAIVDASGAQLLTKQDQTPRKKGKQSKTDKHSNAGSNFVPSSATCTATTDQSNPIQNQPGNAPINILGPVNINNFQAGITDMCTDIQNMLEKVVSRNAQFDAHNTHQPNVNQRQSQGPTPTKEEQEMSSLQKDTELLRKEFPDLDPNYIFTKLEQLKANTDRIPIIRKSIEQKRQKRAVRWSWKTSSTRLSQFSVKESQVIEAKFGNHHARTVDIQFEKACRLLKFDFQAMQMTEKTSKKTATIVRTNEVIKELATDKNQQANKPGRNILPADSFTHPTTWCDQGASSDITAPELLQVFPGTMEFAHVESRLKHSLKQAFVTEIMRVENTWLHRKYAVQRALLQDKNGLGKVNEKELFHGTRLTPPEEIWNSEDGFDMRYSADGLWGRGCYFAVHASYSHHQFTYKTQQGRRIIYQIFLAHVLTGDSINLDPDQSIKKPPVKNTTGGILYDSVTGITQNHPIYVLYKNEMSYPAYLITYVM